MTDELVVQVAQGQLLGVKEGQTQAFYDIPYGQFAERFKYAAAPSPWAGTRLATKPGPIFNQDINRLAPVMGSKQEEKNQSEDAFRLNVWTTGAQTKKPVLFWIHGGGFLTGGGALPWYNGQQLAENGEIVVVTVNYRLGALGHLYQPGVADDNLALHDLLMALTWVKDNIAAFGGDPDQITVAGQSVGAWYTLALFASPLASDMIHRIGLLSFPGAAEPLTTAKAALLTEILCAQLGIADPAELRQVPVEKIVTAQGAVALEMQKRTGDPVPTGFYPYIDGHMITGSIMQGAIDRANAGTQLFTGTTSNETTAFFQQPAMKAQANYLDMVQKTTADIFQAPTQSLAMGFVAQQAPSYLYEMAFAAKDPMILACHCIELPFIFNNFAEWDNAPMLAGLDTAKAYPLAEQMQAYFINFVATGNPNATDQQAWPRLTTKQPEKIIFNQTMTVEAMTDMSSDD